MRSLVPQLHVILAHPDVLVGGNLPSLRHLWQGNWDGQGLRRDYVDLYYGFFKVKGLEVLLCFGWRDGSAELLQNVGVHNDGPQFEVRELLPEMVDLRLNNARAR